MKVWSFTIVQHSVFAVALAWVLSSEVESQILPFVPCEEQEPMQMSNSSIMTCGNTEDTSNETSCEMLHFNDGKYSGDWSLAGSIPIGLTDDCLMVINGTFYYCGEVHDRQAIDHCYVGRRTLELSESAMQEAFKKAIKAVAPLTFTLSQMTLMATVQC